MLSDICRGCLYCQWMIGLGLGVRCSHSKNKRYKNLQSHKNLPVIISLIPDGCVYKEVSTADCAIDKNVK